MVWQAQHRGSVSGYDVPYLVPEYIGNGGKCSDRNLHLRYAYVPYAVHTVLPESVPHELNQQTTDPRRDKMVVVYILLGILAVLLLYICFLCNLQPMRRSEEYEKNSRFYRTLLTALLPLL